MTSTMTSSMQLIERVNEFQTVAQAFTESGLFPDIRTKAQAFVKIMAGAEMGIPPFTAMNSFHVIQGKACLSASAIAARVKASGRYDYRIVEKSSEKCEIQFFEKGKHIHTEVWDRHRAAKMGVKNMDKMPDAMLFARCITAGARAVAPDVVGQYYTPEEMGAAVDDEGNIVDSTARTVGHEQQNAHPEPENQAAEQDAAEAREDAVNRYKTAASSARDRGIDLNGSKALTSDDTAALNAKAAAIAAKVQAFDDAVDDAVDAKETTKT